MAFRYPTIATDSNYHAIALVVSQNGEPASAAGMTVTVTVKDRDTRETIVPADTVVPPSSTSGRWLYWFTPEQVALITSHALWLVEWKVAIGQYTWRLHEPAELPVRKKI